MVVVYILLIGIGVILSLFISINIPLIVFDKSIHVFNILSGGNLLNDVLFNNGNVNWGVENIFFIIYLVLALMSIVVAFFVIAKNTISRVYGFGETNEKKQIVKRVVLYLFGIFLVPLGFFVLNSISVVIAPIFTNYLTKSTNPFDISTIQNSLNIYLNKSQILDDNILLLLGSISQNKNEIISQNILTLDSYNQIIKLLNDTRDINLENIKNVENLLATINTEDISNEQVNLFNKAYNNISIIVNNINSYFDLKIDFNIIVNDSNNNPTYPFIDIVNAEKILKMGIEDYSKLNDSFEGYIRLDQIAWTNNNSAYKTNFLTIQITELVFGKPIYDLYNPFLGIGAIGISAITSFFQGNIWFSIIRIALFIPTIAIVSGIMFNIILKVMKRVLEIIVLMLISPVVSISSINDEGVRWNSWMQTSLSKFFYIGIAAFVLMIYKLVLPELMMLVSKIDSGAKKSYDVQTISLILNLIVLLGSTYGLKEMINFSSGLINESSIGSDVNGLGSSVSTRWKSNNDKANRSRIQNISKTINKRFTSNNKANITSTINKNNFVPKLGKK